jgi:small subunit ribosomal protein S3
MSKKTNPLAFRLGVFEEWRSQWLSDKFYRFYLEQDALVREFLFNTLKDADIENIEIKRNGGQLMNIIIWAARPGLIIGRKGAQIKEIEQNVKKILDNLAVKYKNISKADFPKLSEIKIDIQEVKEPEISAPIVALDIAREIEKRNPYRKVLKKAIAKVTRNPKVKGIKIKISGRLDGAEMARSEWMTAGKIPLQTLRADIDYGFAEALPTYGKLGIKVWIYKGEKFKNENKNN